MVTRSSAVHKSTKDKFQGRSAEAGFFRHICGILPVRKNVSVVCVAHFVDNTRFFLPAVDQLFDLRLVLPKPKSADELVRREIEKRFSCHPLTREWAANPNLVIKALREHGLLGAAMKIMIVDIGGYFAGSICAICEEALGHIIGVMEGTENGLKKYERQEEKLPVPVYTVARSPLKYPENYLIGVSVVFSIESVLRTQAQVLQSRQACVIGFGKVGRSVATALRAHGLSTVVYDSSSLALAEAAARGFQIFRSLEGALQHATLVVGATGNTSLDARGFAALRDGTYVATVTSGDDELDLPALNRGYIRRPISKSLERFHDGAKSFFLINGGNAANFLHGAVVGPAIQLIEGEKLACLSAMASESASSRIHELDTQKRREVADVWLDHFAVDS